MATLQQLRLARMNTISRVKRVTPEKWDFQPAGFNNNIRWNAGHIFVITEKLTKQTFPSYEVKHPEWAKWFDDATSPKDFGEDVPSGEVLLQALRDQLSWIVPEFEENLEKTAEEPLVIGDDIMTISSADGMAQFLAWHEGTHTGLIDGLNKLE